MTTIHTGPGAEPATDAETRVDTHRPRNVIAALARVQAEIGGIAKRTSAQRGKNEPGVNYAYRGIDEIAAAAQPLLGRYGVVIVPTVENHVVDDILVNNKPWTDTTVHVLWRIYGPGGHDDHIEARTVGQGRDNSDKGINKAMTGAYKNLLLRLLTIGDNLDDTDGTTHERDTQQHNPHRLLAIPAWQPGPRARLAYDALPTLTDEAKANLKTLSEEFGRRLTAPDLDADPTWLEVVEAVIQQDLDKTNPASAAQPEPTDHTHAIAERHRQRLHNDLDNIHSDPHPATETGATPPETPPDAHNTTNEDPPQEADQW